MHMPQRKLFFVKMFRVNAISYANRQYITVMVDGGGEGGVKKKKKKKKSILLHSGVKKCLTFSECTSSVLYCDIIMIVTHYIFDL